MQELTCPGAHADVSNTHNQSYMTILQMSPAASCVMTSVRNYADGISPVRVLISPFVTAGGKVNKNTVCEGNITLRGLPRQRCATGRGSRGGGTPRLSSPLRSAAEAPGGGGGPLPGPGCCSLLPGAKKHPSEKNGPQSRFQRKVVQEGLRVLPRST